ncbi:hypothetical protein PSP20601_05069 [Pandoraea sputorum]|nr:hypothetical protein PSP20601_05069 [Pandoraea sputorum]
MYPDMRYFAYGPLSVPGCAKPTPNDEALWVPVAITDKARALRPNEPLGETHRTRPPRREGGEKGRAGQTAGAPGSPVTRIPKMSGVHRSPARPRMPTMTAPLASWPERRHPRYGAISPAPGASDTALTRGS